MVHTAQQLWWYNIGQICTHERHPIHRPYGRVMGSLSRVIQKNTAIYRERTVLRICYIAVDIILKKPFNITFHVHGEMIYTVHQIFHNTEWAIRQPYYRAKLLKSTLQWPYNERDGVSNHRHLHCLLNRLLRGRSKKRSKLHVTGLCKGNPPVTGWFPSQRTSNAENVSISWRHYDTVHYWYLAVIILQCIPNRTP